MKKRSSKKDKYVEGNYHGLSICPLCKMPLIVGKAKLINKDWVCLKCLKQMRGMK